MDTHPQHLMVRFRPMEAADIPRVHEIDVLSFSLPWSERSYRFELTENHNSLILVAEVTQPEGRVEVVGMIVIWVILDEATWRPLPPIQITAGRGSVGVCWRAGCWQPTSGARVCPIWKYGAATWSRRLCITILGLRLLVSGCGIIKIIMKMHC